MRPAHRVLLIGPWRATSAGGSCCGGSVDGLVEHRDDHPPDTPERLEADAAVWALRALRDAVDSGVDVQLVDPRNTMFVLPTVYRDARGAGMGIWTSLTEAVRATSPWALVVDGRVISRSELLTPETAVARLPAAVRAVA